MAIALKSTQGVATDGVKILCHGQSGSGKTYGIGTIPNVVIISAESGLLSLGDKEIPYIEVKTMSDLVESYKWATESDEAKKFETIALDSISEIAEVVLSAEKAKSKDGRAAYGETNDIMANMIRAFRDIRGKNVYMSAKTEKVQDEKGCLLYGPSMPGKTLTNQLAYWFDLVLALRVEQVEGKNVRMVMTETDGLWVAKNRGGRLQPWEKPDFGAIIKKVRNV